MPQAQDTQRATSLIPRCNAAAPHRTPQRTWRRGVCKVQQEELARDGAANVARFRSRGENVEFLPEGVTTRRPDMLFDQEHTLDLGGVHARILLGGPTHTLGDQGIWVPEDRTLLTGDIAMENDPPQRYAAGANATVWIATLDRLAALNPLHVVPDHGDAGDIGLIRDQRAFLAK